MAEFGSYAAALRYYRTEGFKFGLFWCGNCGERLAAAYDPSNDITKQFECSLCKKPEARYVKELTWPT